MDTGFVTLLAIAGAAGFASIGGGVAALLARARSITLSLSVGFAGGVLLGTIAFEMVPKAREAAGLPIVILAFATGLALVYALDMFVNRGALAGEQADQEPKVEAERRRRPPRGSEVSVLAGGTSAEELIEGLSIGVGMAVEPSLGLLVGVAVAIDNVSESLSIGELARAESSERLVFRVLGWTGLIGFAVFASAVVGWLFLRDVPDPVLGALLAAGAGGMFYLTITDLVPEAEAHQYQQSAGLAAAGGFLLILALSSLA